ncbi:hypothetical protein KKF61_07595 [Patescibacteria group bacterium]|nr:hypothetical protein [Patescibacteria group bacterium]
MIPTKLELIEDHPQFELKKGETIMVYGCTANVSSILEPNGGVKLFFIFYSKKLSDWALIHASFLKPYQGVTLTIPQGH